MPAPDLERKKGRDLSFLPALAMLCFFAGSFLFFEAAHFGWDFSSYCSENAMLTLLMATALLQFSVPALFLLPVGALLFGIISAAGMREMISQWTGLALMKGLLPLTAAVILFFLLFARGMEQGMLLYRALLQRDSRQKRELLFSCLIMLGLAGLSLLFRIIIYRY